MHCHVILPGLIACSWRESALTPSGPAVYYSSAEPKWPMLRPDPHPLDFDWRFDATTAESLSQRIPHGRTLLMGCPSVAEALADSGREASLIDRQPLPDLSPRVNHVRVDLRFDLARNNGRRFDTVVLDSPWYTDYLEPWLEQARRHAAPGGVIMFSLWPPETRLSASEEATQILELAASFGPTHIDRNALRYVTPKFELETASASGQILDDHWRRGDLVTVRVHDLADTILKRPVHANRPKAIWRRYIFDKLQIAVRMSKGSHDQEPALISITKGNVLPDVSRRLEIRHKIDLWTSCNIAFAAEGSRHFVEALDRLAAGSLEGMNELSTKAYHILLDNRVLGRGPFEKLHSWQHPE